MPRLVYIFFLIFIAFTSSLLAGERQLRVATFNIAMGFDTPGEMAAALQSGEHPRLLKLAGIVQRVRPDILLLNEFDYDPSLDAASLLNRNYLALGEAFISYAYHFRAPVNTGVDSGLDLDGDGKTGGPGDAWGYGQFPGQYGMLVLSRYPVLEDETRTFRNFPWSELPMANQPGLPNGNPFYPGDTWNQLRLSSKSHWDIALDVQGVEFHLLAHHPTPPVFDGPENRNGLRNFDEIRFWKVYHQAADPEHPENAAWIRDDLGQSGGLDRDKPFVIAGDFNADPFDGDSMPGAMQSLLEADWLDASCEPASEGGAEAAHEQGGVNAQHRGDPALDTSDFNDKYTGNLRLDYLLPSAGLTVTACGVFWPAGDSPGHDLVDVSDHRMVWMDIRL